MDKEQEQEVKRHLIEAGLTEQEADKEVDDFEQFAYPKETVTIKATDLARSMGIEVINL